VRRRFRLVLHLAVLVLLVASVPVAGALRRSLLLLVGLVVALLLRRSLLHRRLRRETFTSSSVGEA